jgi:hypothetical protein
MKARISLLITVLFSLLPFFSKAVSSGDVLGQVIDIDTRQPVPYAEVVFENYYDKVTVTANEHGLYYGFHIPEGRYQMRVIYNNHTFVMNRVKVYDSYSSEVNFFVSCNDTLPAIVRETTPEPVIKPFEPHDILLTSTGTRGATMTLSDVLMAQPGVDIYQGKLYVKGMEVKIFIDGSPVLAPGIFNK